jgi:hypothetical protein
MSTGVRQSKEVQLSKKAALRVGAFAAVLATLLGMAGVAIAAGAAPKLLAPNHEQAAPGRIRLVVEVPLKPARGEVFITIDPKRKIDRFGHLKFCASISCDFVAGKHWRGHDYRYVAQFNFPGYWSVTPGKYYWQADYYPASYSGVYYSHIGWFVVK